ISVNFASNTSKNFPWKTETGATKCSPAPLEAVVAFASRTSRHDRRPVSVRPCPSVHDVSWRSTPREATCAAYLCHVYGKGPGSCGPHCDASPEQEQEIQMLKSKVASLEDEIRRRKEETSQLESIVRERTAQMAALVGELELLQKLNVADDESVMKANTNVDMLEKQIERLGSDLEDQVRKGESLEARATEAEKNWHEFSRKLEHAENINVEQRKKIKDLDDRLQNAQDKLSELEKEAKLKAEGSMCCFQVHAMWLPHWLAVRVVRCQEVASAKWQVHGKPVLGPLMQKVAEKSTYAQQLVEPHLQKTQN
uniref:Uncharacterized protein n=1 Tax=Setaria italica TaxID=4555 RepID=K3YDZ8_SETIT